MRRMVVLQVGFKARGVALSLLCLVCAFIMVWVANGASIHKHYETATPVHNSSLFFPTLSSLLTPLGKYWCWISAQCAQYSVSGRTPRWRIRLAVDRTICFGDYTFHCISGQRVSGRSMIDDRSDFPEERMDIYDEWIHTAKAKHVHPFRYAW